MTESALCFEVEGEQLVGILAEPDTTPAHGLAVLIVVGGPQYRAGSHRQFTLLARHLASHGVPAMRFDYRGMGDSGGAARDFEAVDADIAAAIDAIQSTRPGVRRVVLWGLCDAASAALMYQERQCDARVCGLVLVNPWVRSAATMAKTHVKRYYGQRLLQAEFWRKLLRGGVGWGAVLGLLRTWRASRATTSEVRSFQRVMADGWRRTAQPLLLLLSGKDYTALEFVELTGSSPDWAGLLQRQQVSRTDFPNADHTFSDCSQMEQLMAATLRWLDPLASST